jgi:integrase
MLHKALADAVKWGRVLRNAADAAEQPRKSTPEMRVWAPTELRAFLEHVRRDRLAAAWQLLATTGMRRGELLGLRRVDVDFNAASISIRQTRTAVNYEVTDGSPKTERGTRSIALNPRHPHDAPGTPPTSERKAAGLGRSVDRHRARLFRENGSAIHPQRFSQWFAQHVRRSGLPPIRLHDLRHSYATTVIRAGVPLKVVSQRIGHATDDHDVDLPTRPSRR